MSTTLFDCKSKLMNFCYEFSGLIIYHSQIWERRKDLQGVEVINCVMNADRQFMFPENSSLSPTGYSYDILSMLSKTLNFSFVTVKPPDMKWGFKEPNETYFNGIVGMLQRYKNIITYQDYYFYAHFCN